jgi:hypothetical protein
MKQPQKNVIAMMIIIKKTIAMMIVRLVLMDKDQTIITLPLQKVQLLSTPFKRLVIISKEIWL